MYNLDIIVVGPLQTNCYIVSSKNTLDAVVIDPGDNEDEILSHINEYKLKVKYILNTHAHPDHIKGDLYIKDKTNSKILLHNNDLKMFQVLTKTEPDGFCVDNELIKVSDMEFKVMHTPGHTRGGVCLVLGKVVFTGDTLFAGTIGRTDLPGGSYEDIIKSIKTKLLSLDDSCKIYPGHGDKSTIGDERENNPFLS